jgi:rubrerythrin
MTTHDEIREVLRRAYQIEVDGYTFYSMTADKADKPAVQELFGKLADDEVEHKLYLKDVMGRFEADGVEAFNVAKRDPVLKSFTATIFSDDFRKQAEGADFEVGVLSIGMTLESRAIKYFSGAAEKAEEAEVRDFYTFLADWEKQHLDALQQLYNGVRQDFWADSGFSPF